MGVSGIFSPILGQWYVLLNLQTVILFYLVIKIVEKNLGADLKFFAMLAPFFGLGLWEAVITRALGGNSYYGWTQFVFGFAMPVLLVILLNKLTRQAAAAFFRSFYAGYTFYLITALVVLFFFDQNFYELIETYGLGGGIVALRYNIDSSGFGLLIGNANKQSNYLLILILLGPRLLSESTLLQNGEEASIKIYRVFVFAAVFVLLMLFSRAALLLLPLATLFFGRYLGLKKSHLSILFIFIFIIVGWSNIKLIYDYLLFSKFIDGTDGGVSGSFSNRFDQWDEILEIFTSNISVLVHGMGVGAYGVWLGGDPKAGSHNLFLDHLLASGVLGVLGLVCAIFLSVLLAVKRGSGDILFCIFSFVLLAFREYSFSYLYVTSMGGVVFALIFYVIARSESISSKTKVVAKRIKLGSRKVLSVQNP